MCLLKWICTSNMCQQGFQDVISEGKDDYEDEEDPEDDPDVQDIRWF